MAAPQVGDASTLLLQVLHDGKKHTIQLPNDTNVTVGDVMEEISSELHIPASKQRLIYRGRSLIDVNAHLSSCNIKYGSKLMLIGTVEFAEPHEVMKLDELEVTLDTLKSHLSSLEAASITSGNSKDHINSILSFIESCMKGLEKADSVHLPADDGKQRRRRKVLVDSFQFCCVANGCNVRQFNFTFSPLID
uniref:Ubiquitin-like domain-containing protein n=1 Tax=Mesocestoides corti TaxID=53468 RepID=A0A5K3F757_MESCO